MRPIEVMRLVSAAAPIPPAGYATFDPSNKAAAVTLSGGNKTFATVDTDNMRAYGQGAKTLSAAVLCVEFVVNAVPSGYTMLGWAVSGAPTTGDFAAPAGGLAHYASLGALIDQGGGWGGGYPSYTSGDIIGTSIKYDSGASSVVLKWWKNGVSVGTKNLSYGTAPNFTFSGGGSYDNANATVRTDPADMTYYANYSASDGWTT